VNGYCLGVRAALLALWLTACAGHASPESALRGLLAAHQHDDPRRAHALLSQELRGRISEAELAERWRRDVDERNALATRLRGKVQIRTRARVQSATRLAELVREGGQWRLSTPLLHDAGAETPEEAARRFATALTLRDVETLLRLLGEPLRGAVLHQLSQRAQNLGSAPTSTQTIDQDRVRLLYGDGLYLELKREHGTWKVVDLN
jgi:hypothetical protein